MRILFVMRHSGYVRNFESTLRLLCDRGHKVELAFQAAGTHWLLDASDVAGTLEATYPRFTRSVVPERADAWGAVARDLRLGLDYLRYFEPAYRDASKLRERASRDVPPGLLAWIARATGAGAPGRRALGAGLRALHRAVPCDPRIDAFLEARRPDLLVLTPLIQAGAPQAEFVRSARALGVPTAFCVASWDNLTNKGVVHGPVDLVTVWNEAMKREAVELHGIAAERVAVTGAQPFDHWFGWQPSTGREAFCDRVGLPPGQPYVLYLCSSRFVAPDEVSFVRRWLESLRRADSARLRQAGVLVRPHPQNAGQWRHVDLSDLGPVSVWPRGGAAPSDDAARADYFDSIHHSAGVVGVNTTAEIESAIIGRPVFTVLAPEFRETQDGTLHFHHLRVAGGGLLQVAGDLPAHLGQLAASLDDPAEGRERCRRFVEGFVRPFGLDRPATPRVVSALETLGKAAAPRQARPPRWAPLVQPALARWGERRWREACRVSEAKAIRVAARARRTAAEGRLETVSTGWKGVAESFLALSYPDRIRFGKTVAAELPGEVLRGHASRERLDYPGAELYLRVSSKAERHRLHACVKEPFTIEWIEGFVEAGDVLYDVGANVGVYSLVAACKPGGARVYAFEPSYPNVAALCANVVLNDAGDRITPLPVALSNETGLRRFGLLSLEPGTARHALDETADEGPTLYRQPVFAYRLNDLVAHLGLPPPNHVKLDVDGAELAVLEGASRTLSSPSLRSILVEVSVSLSEALVRVLEARGLRLDRRFNVLDREGEARVWYGLFTRPPEHAPAGRASRVESVDR